MVHMTGTTAEITLESLESLSEESEHSANPASNALRTTIEKGERMTKGTGFFTRSLPSRISRALDAYRETLNEVFYGMTGYELELECRKEKGRMNDLLMLIVFGDFAGLPVFPPYYSMRLLPYIIPSYKMWRRNLMRGKDITETLSGDL